VALTLDSMFSQLGLALVVLNVLLDQAGLPIPAIPTLVVAGAVAADHHVWGMELYIGAIFACVLADMGWYFAGRWYGNRVMRFLCGISLTPDYCVSETQERFERWGQKAVVVAKFVPGLAVIAPPLAGALQMSAARFLILSTVGSALWVASFLAIGALLRAQIDRLLPVIERYAALTLATIIGLLALYIAFKWWERRRFYKSLRMARMSVEELYALMRSGNSPHIVDVRSPAARALEPTRIPGALHLPRAQVSEHIQQLDRNREIILYCTCPNEASAAQVAKLLMQHGFSKVRPLHGGLDAWIAAGYPVETFNSEPTAIVEDVLTDGNPQPAAGPREQQGGARSANAAH
jgi:membrane protein DedA with SNARE-associated domain/rhodanese-related sulfurtransferase